MASVPAVAGFLAIGVGLLVLVGWVLDVPALLAPTPAWGTMKANTALCLLAMGGVLVSHALAGGPRLTRAFAAVVVAVSGLTLVEHVVGMPLGIDELLVTDRGGSGVPGRMAANTALSLVCLGCAGGLIDRPDRRSGVVAAALALFAGVAALLGVLGHAYGVSRLFAVGANTAMSLHTALTLVALVAGVLFARPDVGVARLLTEDSWGSALARPLFPAVAIGLPVAGWLQLAGQRAGWFDQPMGVALAVAGSLVLWGTVFFRAAATVSDADQARRRLEREREALLLDLAATARALETSNHELAGFTYAVAHHLRAPLRAIDGFSTLLADEVGSQLPEEGQRHLRVVKSNARKMAQLIDDLLSFSTLSRRASRAGEVDSEAMVAAVVAQVRAAYPRVEVRCTVGPLPAVTGDEALLRQLWTQLIDNAVKYAQRREVAELHIRGERVGDVVRFHVNDNGVGFDMRYADKVFEVFSRLHGENEFPGTGIGLALAQRIVQRHGGRIWAEGALDGGACFSFELPAEVAPGPA